MKSKFCSQCKRSTYVRVRGKNMLRCAEFSEPLDPSIENPTEDDLREVEELLPTNWTYATYCPFFQPERRQYRTRKQYREMMRLSNIPLEAEKDGILAHETLF